MSYNGDYLSEEEGYPPMDSDYKSQEGYDSSDLDEEDLEVALYSQVHFEVNPEPVEQQGSLDIVITSSGVDSQNMISLDTDGGESGKKTVNEEHQLLASASENLETQEQPAIKTEKRTKTHPSFSKNRGQTYEVSETSSRQSSAYVSVEEDEDDLESTERDKALAKHSTAPLARLLTALGSLTTSSSSSATYKLNKKKVKAKKESVILKASNKIKDGKISLPSTAEEPDISIIEVNGKPDVIEILDDEPSVITIPDSTINETSVVTLYDSRSENSLSSDDDAESLTVPFGINMTTSEAHKNRLDNITLNLLSNDCDMDELQALEAVHKSLGECDWTLHDSDRFGTGSIVGQSTYSRYYGKVNVRCHNCNEKGHLSQDCSKPKKAVVCILCSDMGHISKSCPQSLCYNCSRPGHNSQECEQPRRSRSIECHRCGTVGHMGKSCPDRWRQYHLTTKEGPLVEENQKENKRRFCYNCAKKGHFGYVCTRNTMDKFTEIVSPFIHQYDYVTKKTSRSTKRKMSENYGDELSKTPPKRQRMTQKADKSDKTKTKMSDKISNAAKRFLNTFKGAKNETKQDPAIKKKKKRNKNKNKPPQNLPQTPYSNSGEAKRQPKKKKLKLEHKAFGDFPRNFESDVSKQKSKKQQKKDKYWSNIRKHLNTPSGGSPWQTDRDRGGQQKDRGGQRGGKQKNRGKGHDAVDNDARTVFVSKRGFKVTTKLK